jgi:(S)-2-hydroxyglutarate dehydrogenase
MSGKRYDVAVIGGGIVGLATAMALTTRYRLSLIVLEAEDHVAAHQTGHNSGVIHSGLYYKPGSLKAMNCVSGREALYRFCQDNGIAHERCGKIVVALDQAQLPALDDLERRGRANGLQGITRLDAAGLRDHEPHVAGIAGLHVPETGIVDYVQVAEVYARKMREHGGDLLLRARLRHCQRRADELILETTRGQVLCGNLINCGGLQCDRVARLCGVDPQLHIIPFRGEYYELKRSRWPLVRHLIYPVPDPRFPFLGVHFTRMIHGGIEAGPNAVLALAREGYGGSSFELRDVMEMARFPGFWRMAAKYWQMGLGELVRSWSKWAFWRALRRLLPELALDDIRPAGAGVRAQAVDATGALIDDFRIREAERMIHILNAPSPAATASLSIGNRIAEQAQRHFGLAAYG